MESKYLEFGNVCDLTKSGRSSAPKDDQDNVLLAVEEYHQWKPIGFWFQYISVNSENKCITAMQ